MFKSLLLAAAIAIAAVGAAHAQTASPVQPVPIKRIPLQKFDVPGTNFETVIGIAEIAPNVSIGRHTHPGPESGYMLEGEMVLMVDGQAPKTVKAGESTMFRPARSMTRAPALPAQK